MPLDFEDAVRRLGAARTPQEARAVWQQTLELLGYFTFDYAFGRLKTPNPRSSLDLDAECYLATLNWSAY
jgi:hypothetical protein